MNDHLELVEKFIASFAVVGETLDADEILDPIAWRLATGPSDEQLLLPYRWAEVDLQSFTLLANSPGEGLSGLLQHIMKDFRALVLQTIERAETIRASESPRKHGN